jgi:hypothetical protein
MTITKLFTALLTLGALFGFAFTTQAQSNALLVLEHTDQVEALQGKRSPQIQARNAWYGHLSTPAKSLQTALLEPGQELLLPNPEGGVDTYIVHPNRTMPPELSERFPDIYTADLRSTASRGKWGKVSITPKGLNAMIFDPGKGTIFIDPLYAQDNYLHIVYRKSEFETEKEMMCMTGSTGGKPAGQFDLAKSGQDYNSCVLRTYRIAVAATGEYTAFHGGTIEDALAGIVITLNRVIGIYERDFGVSFTLIDNNELIIYSNAQTDPFSNGNPGSMIQENQSNTNALIGASNYDVGHVFGTNSGGLAGLGVTCTNSQKARGVTGSAAPIGDPFDVDYVAHEIGHQFGSNHSFNNACGGNRNNSTAAEPGSGSTIMAYAGICTPNVQNNSDDHFHGISMAEIGFRISQDNCPVITTINNTSPIILPLNEAVYIPVSTPFTLSAEVTDLELDQLTYNWEQMDVAISPQPPQATSLVGPNFRSFLPIEESTQFFPTATSLALNQVGSWQRLPSVERSMNFRLSVRDNNPLGGCTQYADVNINVVDIDGPFALTYPNAIFISWQAFDYETVTWNVAGTDLAPINSDFIDLYLSTTSQPDFNILLAESVPNTGSYTVQVPNIGTNAARVMARSAEGNFYDLSAFNFSIEALTEGFALSADQLMASGCQGEVYTYSLSANIVGGLEGAIALSIADLPEGITANLSQDSLDEGEEVLLVVNTSLETDAGVNSIVINGLSGDFEASISVQVNLSSAILQQAALLLPANASTDASTNALLQWETSLTTGGVFSVQISENEDFENIIEQVDSIVGNTYTTQNLVAETEYFWRVSGSNECTSSAYTDPFSFTTFSCLTGLGVEADLQIPPAAGLINSSTLEVTSSDEVAAISLQNITGSHSDISQLYFRLEGPSGAVVGLGGVPCGLDVNLTSDGEVNASISGAGSLTLPASGTADFGPPAGAGGTNAMAVLAYDASGSTANELCGDAINTEVIEGKIAIVRRGTCPFTEKVINAQAAGAVGVIVINNGAGFIEMGGTSSEIFIPSVMVSAASGTDLLDAISALPIAFNLSFKSLAILPEVAICGSEVALVPPVEDLNTFVGTTAQGDWNLQVINLAGQGVGSLDSWQLELCVLQQLVSVEEVPRQSIVLFPNPTEGVTTVQWEDEGSFEHLRVTDLSGRLLHAERVTGKRTLNLNISGFATGVYLLNLSGNGHVHTSKIVLSR